MTAYCHLDGEVVPLADATVSVRDRGFRYGDAVVETVRAYGGHLFRPEAHLDRFAEGCDRLGFDPGVDRAALRARLAATLEANGLADAGLRLSVSRGVDDGGLTPPADPDPTVLVTAESLPRGGRDGERPWDGPASVQTVRTRHVPDDVVPARARTHSSLDRVLARRELVEGADEALLRDADGNVAEGTASNLFFVADGALCTPSLDGPVLPGVTREVVLELAEGESFPVEEGSYTPADVRAADEAFLTGTTRELRPVATVDGVDVGGGPVTALLSRLFDERVAALYERNA
jgi:branched-chain amino acid aminotransferase